MTKNTAPLALRCVVSALFHGDVHPTALTLHCLGCYVLRVHDLLVFSPRCVSRTAPTSEAAPAPAAHPAYTVAQRRLAPHQATALRPLLPLPLCVAAYPKIFGVVADFCENFSSWPFRRVRALRPGAGSGRSGRAASQAPRLQWQCPLPTCPTPGNALRPPTFFNLPPMCCSFREQHRSRTGI